MRSRLILRPPRRPLDRLHFLRQPQSLLRHTTMLPQRSHCNRHHQNATNSICFLISWSSILHPGCNHDSACRNSSPVLHFNDVRFVFAKESRALDERFGPRYLWETPCNFRFLSLILPGRQANSLLASERQVLLKHHTPQQPTPRDPRR